MTRRLPPLNALRAFEAAARLGRMTAAAEELSVTPGAISRQVRQLEQALGVPLFEGAKNKPQLTAAGASLRPALSAALDQMEAAVREVRSSEAGTLDVSCFSTFTVKWLIPRLYGFNALHPDIEIRLSAAERAGVDRDRYDLVITAQDHMSDESAALLPLFAERLGPVLAPALAAGMDLRSPQGLASQPLLHTKTRPNAWQMWCESTGRALPARAGPAFEHYYFTLEAAVGGLGICIAPWHLVIDDIRAGRLVAPLGFQESGYQYVAKRRLDSPDRKLDKFCAWLAAQARDTPLPWGGRIA
jgi:DNA-binding transcriptional LysR family regulator